MKTALKKKKAGFFLIEILVVLVIIGILVVAMTPSYITYTNRAKFVDVINQANALKSAVEGCILQTGVPGNAISTCAAGSNGVPSPDNAVTTGTSNYVATSTTAATGAITVTSRNISIGSTSSFSYILTPTLNANGTVTWSVNTASTCLAAGLC